jgi:hypothetical protein
MPIKTTDGHTTLEGGGDMFTIVKFASLHMPSICTDKYETTINYVKVEVSILEAIISDIVDNKQIPNAIFGVNIMLLLPIMKEIQIIDCEGFKLWCILYFIWNMTFCKNKGFGTQESFAHNYPTLIKTLLSFGYTPTELMNDFMCRRSASIMTFFIDKYR